MNYGTSGVPSTGQYGMGGGNGPQGMPTAPTGIPSMQHQQQRGMMMQQTQQQGIPSMRQMYQQGGQGGMPTGQAMMQQQQGPMAPMGHQQQMYPQQHMGQPMIQHQIQSQPQLQQQQQSRQYIQNMMAHFPPDWQQKINSETNPETRQKLFKTLSAKFLQHQQMAQQQRQSHMMMSQQQQQQQQQQQMPMMNNGAPPQMRQVASSGSMMYPSPMSVQPQGSVPMSHTPQPGQIRMTMNSMPQSQMMVMSSHSPSMGGMVSSPQVHSLASQPIHCGSPLAQGHTNSPQMNQMQPSTPQNSIQQPTSVEGGPGSQQPASVSSQDNTQEYNELVKMYKDKYLDQLRRIRDRCALDNIQHPSGLDKLIEILDDRRRVELPLLKKVHQGIRGMIDNASLTHPLTSLIKTWEKEDGSNIDESIIMVGSITTDPWRDVNHLRIRVPDHIARLYKDDYKEKEQEDVKIVKEEIIENNRKRKMEDMDNNIINVISAKKSRIEDMMGGIENVTKAVKEEGGSTAQSPLSEDEDIKRIEIKCLFDTRLPWMMSSEASRELEDIPWKVDTECLPASSNSPEAVICFNSDVLTCPPLKVVVPQSYPIEPAVVQFDRSFPRGIQLSAQLASYFERELSMAPVRSLTNLYESYRTACRQLMRMNHIHNGLYYQRIAA